VSPPPASWLQCDHWLRFGGGRETLPPRPRPHLLNANAGRVQRVAGRTRLPQEERRDSHGRRVRLGGLSLPQNDTGGAGPRRRGGERPPQARRLCHWRGGCHRGCGVISSAGPRGRPVPLGRGRGVSLDAKGTEGADSGGEWQEASSCHTDCRPENGNGSQQSGSPTRWGRPRNGKGFSETQH